MFLVVWSSQWLAGFSSREFHLEELLLAVNGFGAFSTVAYFRPCAVCFGAAKGFSRVVGFGFRGSGLPQRTYGLEFENIRMFG